MGLKMGLSETHKSNPLLALVYSFSLAVAQPQSHTHIYISTKPNTFKSIITITILHMRMQAGIFPSPRTPVHEAILVASESQNPSTH